MVLESRARATVAFLDNKNHRIILWFDKSDSKGFKRSLFESIYYPNYHIGWAIGYGEKLAVNF